MCEAEEQEMVGQKLKGSHASTTEDMSNELVLSNALPASFCRVPTCWQQEGGGKGTACGMWPFNSLLSQQEGEI